MLRLVTGFRGIRRWLPRGRAADAVLAIAVGALVIVSTAFVESPAGGANRPSDVEPLAWLLIVIACGVLYFRRRAPVPVAVCTLVAAGIYYPFTSPDGPILLSFVVALYTVAAEGHVVAAVTLGTVAMLAVTWGEISNTAGRQVDNMAYFLLAGWLIAVISVGAVTYNRKAYLRVADQRALDAERGKEEAARQRATEERLRIARELHNVLGHHISLINVQASAALHRIKKDPDQVADALGAIKQASKAALRDLRATLGLLRLVDEEAPTAPAPSLTRLSELVDHAAATGLAVRTEVDGQPRPVPPEVDLAAYRIVQEALTNVTRHAAASTAVVRIHYGDDDVRVQVDDDGAGASPATANGDDGMPGNGIRGMGERARALGGELTTGGRPDGGFQVRARLPLGGVS
jgi:signal transduction histidine kinase